MPCLDRFRVERTAYKHEEWRANMPTNTEGYGPKCRDGVRARLSARDSEGHKKQIFRPIVA